MSNHDGGYLLNEFMKGLVDIGLMNNISNDTKASIANLLHELCYDHDCNWGEIIDIDLAMLLGCCCSCANTSEEVNPKNGYCVDCAKDMKDG